MKVQFFRTTHPSKKLADKFLGPYKVIAQPGTHSVMQRLPDNLCAVHPVFHISMLEPTTPNTITDRVQPPPPPIFVDGELEFKIAEILDSKVDQQHHITANCYNSSTGPGMLVLMRRPLGSLLRSLETHPNWLWTIMWPTQPSWAPSIESNTNELVGTREITYCSDSSSLTCQVI